jgi:hypothetical protein
MADSPARRICGAESARRIAANRLQHIAMVCGRHSARLTPAPATAQNDQAKSQPVRNEIAANGRASERVSSQRTPRAYAPECGASASMTSCRVKSSGSLCFLRLLRCRRAGELVLRSAAERGGAARMRSRTLPSTLVKVALSR